MPDDFIAVIRPSDIRDRHRRVRLHVIQAAALHASHMIMVRQVRIKTSLRTAKLKFFNHTVSRESLKISVHCAQADAGEPLPDYLIDLVGCRMRIHPFKRIKDELPLSSHPNATGVGQFLHLLDVIDNHYY